MNDWKNDRAEAEMRKSGEDIMKKAAEDAAKKKTRESIGRWTINVKSSTEYTSEDLERLVSKLLDFEVQCNQEFPMLRMHIDPIVE